MAGALIPLGLTITLSSFPSGPVPRCTGANPIRRHRGAGGTHQAGAEPRQGSAASETPNLPKTHPTLIPTPRPPGRARRRRLHGSQSEAAGPGEQDPGARLISMEMYAAHKRTGARLIRAAPLIHRQPPARTSPGLFLGGFTKQMYLIKKETPEQPGSVAARSGAALAPRDPGASLAGPDTTFWSPRHNPKPPVLAVPLTGTPLGIFPLPTGPNPASPHPPFGSPPSRLSASPPQNPARGSSPEGECYGKVTNAPLQPFYRP